jgi:hypothetical protein
MLAQQSAAAVRAADVRSRAALYRALGRAYDFALATEQDRQGYQALLDQAGITVQARAPMTPIIKLVFGLDYDKTRVTEFSTVLDLAQRRSVPAGELGAWLDTVPGGIKGAVKAMREERRPADRPEPMAAVRAQLSRRPAVASVAVPTGVAPGDFVVLVARAAEHGQLDILASLEGDKVLTARALRQAAA